MKVQMRMFFPNCYRYVRQTLQEEMVRKTTVNYTVVNCCSFHLFFFSILMSLKTSHSNLPCFPTCCITWSTHLILQYTASHPSVTRLAALPRCSPAHRLSARSSLVIPNSLSVCGLSVCLPAFFCFLYNLYCWLVWWSHLVCHACFWLLV